MLFVEDQALARESARRGHKVVMPSALSAFASHSAADLIRLRDPSLIWIRLPRGAELQTRRRQPRDWRVRAATRLAAAAHRRRIHWTLEHPTQVSVEIAQLSKRVSVEDIDMCAFGCASRRRTRFVSSLHLHAVRAVCQEGPICCFSCGPHSAASPGHTMSFVLALGACVSPQLAKPTIDPASACA